MASIMDVIRLFRKLTPSETQELQKVQPFIDEYLFEELTRLKKQRKVEISFKKDIFNNEFPVITGTNNALEYIANDIKKNHYGLFKQTIQKDPLAQLSKFIAPEIIGHDDIKQATILQMVSNEPIHILLLGDPGTGKTDILRSVQNLSDISSFGLGSGTTGAGLGVTMIGNEMHKGLLALADKGVCLIDELNLMKKEDRAYLYSAMEKGFITYDKKGRHEKISTDVKVLATANPKGDKFTAKTITTLKMQLPFDAALLSRFHMVFFIRQPNAEEFEKIAAKIAKNKKTTIDPYDLELFMQYITETKKRSVDLDETLEQEIKAFAATLKKIESKTLVEISPRLIIGLIRLSKSIAKLKQQNTVTHQDVILIKELMLKSLKI